MNQITNEYQKAQELASSEGGRVAADGCQHCHDGNWIHLRYEYPDEQAVTDATYVVQKPNGGEPGGEVITEGVLTVTELSRHKYIHVDLSDYDGEVEVFFFDDPTEPVPFEEPAPVEDERTWLERAAESVASGVASGAQWSWQTLQGDFNEDMSTGQIITNAIVTAVPVVDQVADLRDLIANGKLLIWEKRYTELGVWVGVVACLIGLVPSLGSLAKGVIKIIWKNASEMGRVLVYINKALHRTGMRVNGYRFVTKLADDVVDQVGFVSRKFDEFLDLTAQKVSLLKNLSPDIVNDALATIEELCRIGPQKINAAAHAIRERILRAIGDYATKAFAVLPGQSIIVQRAIRAFGKLGPYKSWQRAMGREGFDAAPLEQGAKQINENIEVRLANIRKAAPRWYNELLEDKKLPGTLREAMKQDPERFIKVLETFGSKPTYRNFDPGEKLYRVVNDEKGYEGQFWSPAKPPETEAEWRARDAVLNEWNNGGGYIIAEVPPPPAAFVGDIAPQNLAQIDGKEGYYLEGGGTQIWLPRDYPKPTIKSDQIDEYWYTDWNASVDAVRASRKAGTISECDL